MIDYPLELSYERLLLLCLNNRKKIADDVVYGLMG